MELFSQELPGLCEAEHETAADFFEFWSSQSAWANGSGYKQL